MNRGERAGAIEHDELTGVAAVSLDAVAGASWNQRRRDDVTRNAVRGQRALQLEATGAGLVAAPHRARVTEALNEAQNRGTVGRQRM